MGVEYRHYLIPENPSFVPSSGVIKRIDAMLEKWKLKAGDPVIYNFSKEGLSVVKAPVQSLIFGQGFGLKYPHPDEGGFKIPNKDFISDVEEALGCKVIEVGSIG